MKVKGSETFELTFHKGARIRRLVAKNGKPLSPKEKPTRRRTSRNASARSKREAEKERKEREAAQKATKNSNANTNGDPDGDQPKGASPRRPAEAPKRMNAKIAPRSPTCCGRRSWSIRAANASARAT